MLLTIGNYRRATCQLSQRNVMCVDVAAKNGLRATIDCRKLPELVASLAFQLKLSTANGPTDAE